MPEQPPPQDPFELFRRLWGPLGVPIPGMAMPTLDPAEIEKRIADLRSIEGWLNMQPRPELGVGEPADGPFLDSTVGLVWRALVLWVFVLLVVTVARLL